MIQDTRSYLERRGQEKFIWPDGAFYAGKWDNGVRSVYGYMQWSRGETMDSLFCLDDNDLIANVKEVMKTIT